MTTQTLPVDRGRRYAFNVYHHGKLVRELVVVAANPLIAEINAPRHLSDGEYIWYVVPRLLSDEEVSS